MVANRYFDARIVLHSTYMKYYVRFGKLPKNGRSGISAAHQAFVLARTGFRIPKREKGISAYHAKWDGRRKKWIMPTVGWDSYVLGMEELLESACAGKRPVYLVAGTEVGEGEDGEPLLAGVSIIEELDVRDLWNDEAMSTGYWDPDWECKPRKKR